MGFAGRIISNISLIAGEFCAQFSWPRKFSLGFSYTNPIFSLEKEPPRRATPWRMLEHPWIVDMKSKKVNMANFLKQVWDWKE